ncbi:uncharacterized protein LOC112340733 [Selaginella moellendorffii]|uniref:uncharacterized protein LOC112340733 n=1 Tax=Selaginella moellendorffii TaxID=88036 RepID=UPI000D1C707E|nr:uncharacterized protein LOC112340733 [Selaginella moellendorffii]|eukprot:XP_024515435.1 uncharacterized protein LOC112340733 [Selaginella moellendorffii]
MERFAGIDVEDLRHSYTVVRRESTEGVLVAEDDGRASILDAAKQILGSVSVAKTQKESIKPSNSSGKYVMVDQGDPRIAWHWKSKQARSRSWKTIFACLLGLRSYGGENLIYTCDYNCHLECVRMWKIL